ncbi:terminase gpA endonuclease subunit [Pedobacter ureilyticus]|uniref:Terminase gpA endonuclease subunit n=1 Tax=Pedobacter ureilyticus TaxID=1393051 RepID=A0ABW9J394_9SPHI|nr:terminase gpA endonuclease subunit [Pedobacter helvus]
MINYTEINNARISALREINADIFGFNLVKPLPADWMEKTIYIPASTSVRPGLYSFEFTPYMREIVNILHPTDITRFVSIIKDGQSGFTTALVVGGICYIISETPDGILFTASDIQLAAKTVEERLDPVIRSSSLNHLIRPNVIKRSNNRSGDTSKKKEFAGGTLTSAGTNSANTFRMFSAKYIFADDYDTSPTEIGKEGSPKMVMKTRQNSFGDKAKTFMISTPTVTQTSATYKQYLLGTQEKWNWPCPHCGQYFPVEWFVKLEDGSKSGVIYDLDDEKKLIPDSIRYVTPCCKGIILEKEKYDLNLLGKWIPTVEKPVERNHRSFQKNSIYNPPGFDGWRTLVEEWLAANPHGEKANTLLLKVFNNLRLGLPYAEVGEAPRVNELMENTREYVPGVIPDLTCEKDGNGSIIMLTLSCDINGIMETDNEDVRLDWEILAHSSSGPTYSVDHGSIGTFKRLRDKSKAERENDHNRDKYTLSHGMNFSVWPLFEELIRKSYPMESNTSETRNIDITVVDTGFGEKLAMQFIKSLYADGIMIYGVKGRVEDSYTKITVDKTKISRSKEHPKHLYNIEVNLVKEDLASFMKLKTGDDGTQPSGFMNYPQPTDGKYTMKSYFIHYEGERKTEVKKNNETVGFRWEKKNNQSLNHFWDVRIYNLVAPLVYLDIVKQSDPSLKNLTWEEFVMMITQ